MGSSYVDYRDSEGIRRRVVMPADSTEDPEEGIPVSLPVDSLYAHMPIEFRIELVDALWAVGLVEAGDFLQPGAAQRAQAALLSVARHDALDIVALAKEVKKHG